MVNIVTLRCAGRLTGFSKDSRGTVSVMTAIVMTILLCALAVGLDISKAHNNKSRLADASDAVSLMLARSDFTSEARMYQAAQDYLDTAYPGTNGARLEILDIDKNGDTVTVKLRNVSDTAFSPLMAKQSLTTSVSSTATFSRTSMDIALVLDSTGSMRGSKMRTLKRAAHDMVDAIAANDTADVRMSVVPFANYVNVGTAARSQSWLNVKADTKARKWEGCVGSRSVPYNLDAPANGRKIPGLRSNHPVRSKRVTCGSALQPLTAKFSDVKRTISSLNASGWTYMPSGLIWGWRTLDDRAPFAHTTPAGTQKVLVLMTDGENTRAKNGVLHNQAGMNRKADQTTRDLCSAIKGENIRIYTIAYEVSHAPTRALLEGCASSPAAYFDAKNASDLNDAFSEIANELNQLRISA